MISWPISTPSIRNGAYIEGYINFTSPAATYDPTACFHGTFMGFYGDWAQAPVMEQLDWIDVMTDNTDVTCNTWPNLAYLAAIRGNSITSSSLAGTNPFDSELDLPVRCGQNRSFQPGCRICARADAVHAADDAPQCPPPDHGCLQP